MSLDKAHLVLEIVAREVEWEVALRWVEVDAIGVAVAPPYLIGPCRAA
jgi:hypothetical protein